MGENELEYSFAIGGEDELSHAIELYGQVLLRYCHNILCDYFEAQDAVQITFIKAYRRRKSFKTGTSLSAWLYRIAYNTCIDLLRKKKLLFFIPKNFIPKNKSDNNPSHIGEDLKTALLTLSPEERSLVFGRIIDEKTYAELEDIYQVSAATLRKRYERAKKKLSKQLQETNSYYKRLEDME